jgi:hypothetical protein
LSYLQCIVLSKNCCGENAAVAKISPIFQLVSVFQRSVTQSSVAHAAHQAVTIKARVCCVCDCIFSILQYKLVIVRNSHKRKLIYSKQFFFLHGQTSSLFSKLGATWGDLWRSGLAPVSAAGNEYAAGSAVVQTTVAARNFQTGIRRLMNRSSGVFSEFFGFLPSFKW